MGWYLHIERRSRLRCPIAARVVPPKFAAQLRPHAPNCTKTVPERIEFKLGYA